MRIALYFTSCLVLLMLPLAVIGSYLTYTQARTRVAELNEITPLENTDLEKVVRLALSLEEAEATTEVVQSETPIAASPDATPTPVSVFAVEQTPLPDVEATAEVISGTAEATATEVAVNSEPRTVDPRRVTVLLMGIDQREGEEGQFRTDTMIVLSLDPVGKTGAMLSIPRDLWVSIPGTSQQGRINTANFVGDAPDLNYPGGGPALAKLTVERLIGQQIDHYILINFDAFTTIMESVGNVEICVQERIDDPKYPDGSYGFLPIVIEPGCQEMDANRLLQYSRTRATSGGDFDRAKRQQETILAVRNKILTTDGVGALLTNALPIWESVSRNIRTDLTLDQIVELGLIASEVNDIRSGTISTGEVLEGTGPDGSQILIPIQTDILALVSDLFRPPNRPAATSNELPIPDPNNVPLTVREEAPIIALLNGTSIQGRAGSLEPFILSYNLDVGFIGNSPDAPNVVESYIIVYGDHRVSGEYVSYVLATINGNNVPTIEYRDGDSPDGDVIIVIGTDLNIPQ